VFEIYVWENVRQRKGQIWENVDREIWGNRLRILTDSFVGEFGGKVNKMIEPFSETINKIL
jgi:hypothetical protein